ncbi:hypothetical protein CLOLEP_00500 [[Clostridium] leptum DSM 753]|uniref:Uncharacterized protein n=1 Tax=[Clostridium] leptum DSM 753 TaxID=428125 RepID=A7VPM4_9FIRM|nr:hypothetical protein CLOLEP_00500 [[Clostridium] leptum DSM 753]
MKYTSYYTDQIKFVNPDLPWSYWLLAEKWTKRLVV